MQDIDADQPRLRERKGCGTYTPRFVTIRPERGLSPTPAPLVEKTNRGISNRQNRPRSNRRHGRYRNSRASLPLSHSCPEQTPDRGRDGHCKSPPEGDPKHRWPDWSATDASAEYSKHDETEHGYDGYRRHERRTGCQRDYQQWSGRAESECQCGRDRGLQRPSRGNLGYAEFVTSMSGKCILRHHLIGNCRSRLSFYAASFVDSDQLISLQVGLLPKFRGFPSEVCLLRV